MASTALEAKEALANENDASLAPSHQHLAEQVLVALALGHENRKLFALGGRRRTAKVHLHALHDDPLEVQMVQHVADMCPAHRGQFDGRLIAAAGDWLDGRQIDLHAAPVHVIKQLRLRAVIVIDPALGGVEMIGHRVDAGGIVAGFHEAVGGSGDDGLAAVITRHGLAGRRRFPCPALRAMVVRGGLFVVAGLGHGAGDFSLYGIDNILPSMLSNAKMWRIWQDGGKWES